MRLIAALLLAVPCAAFAHGGAVGPDQCHVNHATQQRHCHPLEGTAEVVDGDTLVIGRRHIRLEGIDALETAQMCTRDGKRWACGRRATTALMEFLDGKTVACKDVGRDGYGRTLGICSAGGVDINDWMVREGWAMAYRRYSPRYIGAEQAAREARRNIWSGTFVEPESYRHRKR
jgi:endonuclease YncB( thermonuclease family)